MIGIYLGMVLILYGSIVAVMHLLSLGQAAQARQQKIDTWLHQTARITSVYAHEIRDASSLVPSKAFRVELVYEYLVNGVSYTSRQALKGGYFHGQTQEQIAGSVQMRYPIGANIRIIYNPKNPRFTLLGQPEPKPAAYRDLSYGLISIALGVGTMGMGSLLVNGLPG